MSYTRPVTKNVLDLVATTTGQRVCEDCAKQASGRLARIVARWFRS